MSTIEIPVSFVPFAIGFMVQYHPVSFIGLCMLVVALMIAIICGLLGNTNRFEGTILSLIVLGIVIAFIGMLIEFFQQNTFVIT